MNLSGGGFPADSHPHIAGEREFKMGNQDHPTHTDNQESLSVLRARLAEIHERLLAGLWHLRSRNRTPRPHDSGPETSTSHAAKVDARLSGAAEPALRGGADAAPATEPSPSIVRPDLPKGITPEDFVIKLLQANGGVLAWQPLCDELGWSMQTSREILHGMATTDRIVIQSTEYNRKVARLPQFGPSSLSADSSA